MENDETEDQLKYELQQEYLDRGCLPLIIGVVLGIILFYKLFNWML